MCEGRHDEKFRAEMDAWWEKNIQAPSDRERGYSCARAAHVMGGEYVPSTSYEAEGRDRFLATLKKE